MTKRDKYVKELSKTNFVTDLTSSMFAHELGARALLKILIDKGLITHEEWISAITDVTERFVDLHVQEYDEEYEPDFLDFTPGKE